MTEIKSIFFGLSNGLRVSRAIKALNELGLEVRITHGYQISYNFVDEDGVYRTCQSHPRWLELYPIDADWMDFQYGYLPTKGELMSLLENFLVYGMSLRQNMSPIEDIF